MYTNESIFSSRQYGTPPFLDYHAYNYVNSDLDSSRQTRRRFQSLALKWKGDTLAESSATRMAEHPAYRAIIAMGPDVVPLILEDLAVTRQHWFIALSEITGENPVSEEDRGRVKNMSDAWLDWGRQQGLL